MVDTHKTYQREKMHRRLPTWIELGDTNAIRQVALACARAGLSAIAAEGDFWTAYDIGPAAYVVQKEIDRLEAEHQ
jgi:hypothetical protein